jgi:GH43 family beta-xylosidase
MPVQEGLQVLRHGGRTFVVYSASGSWTDDYAYGLLALTGGDARAPGSRTKSSQPAFEKTETVFGPGHGSFVLSPDGTQDWMVYHTARSSGSGWDRVIQAQTFTWTSEGMPDVGTPIGAGVAQAVPAGQQPGAG